MKTNENDPIPPEQLAELAELLRNPYAAPDPDDMAKACKRMDRMRTETRKSMGELDVAVDLIRAGRK